MSFSFIIYYLPILTAFEPGDLGIESDLSATLLPYRWDEAENTHLLCNEKYHCTAFSLTCSHSADLLMLN